jgi:hypothetical protein
VTGRSGAGASAAGAAPAADTIAIQVFSRFKGEQCEDGAEKHCALSFESDHVAGLQHVFRLRNTFKIGAARLSLGTGLDSLACSDNPLKPAIDNLRSVGIPTLIGLGDGELHDTAEAPPCISAAAAPNAKSAATALPDLIVSAGSLEQAFPTPSADFAMRGVETTFLWDHTTKNIGQATKTASRTAVGFVVRNSLVGGKSLPVPGLRSGKAKSGNGEFSQNFAFFRFGPYRTKICADARDTVTESSDTNNCTSTGPFYVIPADLSGSVSGIIKSPDGVTVKWEGTADFGFTERSLFFEYAVRPGASLKFTVSGTVGPCSYSGTAEYQPSLSAVDFFHIFFDLGYWFFNRIEDNFFVPYTEKCTGMPPIKGKYNLGGEPWITNGGWKKFPSRGFLHGQFVNGDATYTWSLRADN